MRLPAIALRPLIGSVLTLVCVACIGACLLLTGWLAVRHETAQIGNNLAISASSLRDRLQPRLESRLRDIELLTLPLGLLPGSGGAEGKQARAGRPCRTAAGLFLDRCGGTRRHGAGGHSRCPRGGECRKSALVPRRT